MISAPDAHFSTATITITADGSWKGHFVPTQDPQYSSSTKDSSGTWTVTGTALQVTVDALYGSNPEEGTASSVPTSVSGDESAQFSWAYNKDQPRTIQAGYDAKAKKLTLTVDGVRGTRTITAIRS